MNQRTDYERLVMDTDGNAYWWTKSEVKYASENPTTNEIRKWFLQREQDFSETSLYYKGTAIYFTYKSKKYYLSWTFYGKALIKETIEKLRKIGAKNIQINYGELD